MRNGHWLGEIAPWLMLAAAASIVVSIAVSQILLGLALIALVGSRVRLRFPPVGAPLFLFLGLTLVSMLLSGDPGAGLPQVRKFFVFSVLLVVSSVLLEARQARWLVAAWTALATLSALRSVVQFGRKVELARARGEDFYQSYVGERITGFLSHWMTFSEVGMLVLLALLSYLWFATGIGRRSRWLGSLAVLVLLLSLLVSFTRAIWLGTAAAVCYLVWHWRRKLLLAAPVVVAVLLLASPGAMQRRLRSIVEGRSDSSIQARLIMWRTGWRMIQERPWLGVGPERVGREFERYVPADAGPLPPAFYGHLHNLYIHYAAERGVLALAALMWLFSRVIWDHWRALRSAAGEDRFILHAVLAATLALLVTGMFDVNLGDSEVLTFFLILVALGYNAIRRQEAAGGA